MLTMTPPTIDLWKPHIVSNHGLGALFSPFRQQKAYPKILTTKMTPKELASAAAGINPMKIDKAVR